MTVWIMLRYCGCRTGTCAVCCHKDGAQELADAGVRTIVKQANNREEKVADSFGKSSIKSQAGISIRWGEAIQDQQAEDTVGSQGMVNNESSGSDEVRRQAGSEHRRSRKQVWSWITEADNYSATLLNSVIP